MNILKYKNIFFTVSGIAFIVSVLLWISLGLNLGIDFTGGSLLEVEYTKARPSTDEIRSRLEQFELGTINIQPVGEHGYNLRFQEISEDTHQKIISALEPTESIDENDSSKEEKEVLLETEEGDLEADVMVSDENVNTLIENRFTSIGPTIGNELRQDAINMSIIVVIAIVLFIAWAFRKVSYPVQSWKYGIVSIIALIHDVVITLGIFILLGHFYGIEINAPFVAAILTILGYSVNDTIVVFDRIREILHKAEGSFDEIVTLSVKETISRSINTSFTTLLVLIAILVFGGATISDFLLALIIGITLGTYSSIFIAAPLLLVWQKLSWKLKKSQAS